jgi:hypothetical protein
MKNNKKYYAYLLLIVVLSVNCEKDDNDYVGQMNATINGVEVPLQPDKAKVYVNPNNLITILGRNCSEGKVVVILEVPTAVGDYTMEGISDMSFYRNSPLACNESGSLNPRNVIEASVSVIEVTNNRIKGTFSLVAASLDPQVVVLNTIENGTFDVERGELFE